VHVHVHRGGQTLAEVEPPRVPTRAVARNVRRRPTLSGELFDWKEHYHPVVKRHHDAITRKLPGAWGGLTKVLRPIRVLVTMLAALAFLKRP
jgi:hypothetical protein